MLYLGSQIEDTYVKMALAVMDDYENNMLIAKHAKHTEYNTYIQHKKYPIPLRLHDSDGGSLPYLEIGQSLCSEFFCGELLRIMDVDIDCPDSEYISLFHDSTITIGFNEVGNRGLMEIIDVSKHLDSSKLFEFLIEMRNTELPQTKK